MDPSQVLREARQAAGLSQRALARRSGVGARTLAAVESGSRQPSVAVLSRALQACGQQLAVHDGEPEASGPTACAHLRHHLRRSLTERWQAAAEQTGRSPELHAALRGAVGELVLEAAGALPVWAPGAALELPLVVQAHTWRPPGRAPALDPSLLVVRRRTAPVPVGLVRLRATGTLDLHVLPPAVLARQHCCRSWRPALVAAAALLHSEAGLDDAGRRAPAHRQPDEDEEARRLSHALRWTGLPKPDAADSRALRLDAPVSLPQWLDERGLPPLARRRGH